MKKIQWHVTYETVIDAFEKNVYNDYVHHQWERAAWSYCRHQSWIQGTLETFEKLPKEKKEWCLLHSSKTIAQRLLSMQNRGILPDPVIIQLSRFGCRHPLRNL